MNSSSIKSSKRTVVTAAVIIKEGKILIARRDKNSSMGGLWEFPGGKVEFGETDKDCLIREIKEEMSIEIEIDSLFHIVPFSFKKKKYKLKAYTAIYKSGEIKLNAHDKIHWTEPNQLDLFAFSPADIPIKDKIQSLQDN